MFQNSNIPRLGSSFFILLYPSLSIFQIYLSLSLRCCNQNHIWYSKCWHAIILFSKSCRMRPTTVRTFLAIEQIRSQCLQRTTYIHFLSQNIDYKRSRNLKYSLDFPPSIYWLKPKSRVPFFYLHIFL